jgi:hypothetical protein
MTIGYEGIKMTIRKEHNADQLSQIYREMNETGKEKLSQVSRQILNIWNIVNEGTWVSIDKVKDFGFKQ